MDEFELIDLFKAPFTAQRPEVVLGPGDDAALLATLAGSEEAWVISTDTVLADRHFPASAPPALVGYRALAVNLSDLAAMGARSVACFVSAVLPDDDPVRIAGLAQGMAYLANRTGTVLAGGNLAQGDFALTIAVHGLVLPAAALRRDQALAGDDVWVSGAIGGAQVGLQEALAGAEAILPVLRHQTELPLARYYTPSPRLALGQALCGTATAAIDVSDGLVSDLGHIARASEVCARLDGASLPLGSGVTGWADAATAGDDYELCFTAPATKRARVQQIAGRCGVAVTRIGSIEAVAEDSAATVAFQSAGADALSPAASGSSTPGYRHFT